MMGNFQFLGTGASAGVPVIGCKCSVCSSSLPFNSRLRTSGLLKLEGSTFLIDVGPDFRQQALRYKIGHLDGLLLTHIHFDHIAGIDDLRVFYIRQKKALPCLLSEESLHELQRRYFYLFQPAEQDQTVGMQIQPTLLEKGSGEIDFCGAKFKYCSYFQGKTKVTGFRLGSFAYISDIKKYDESIFFQLEGVEKLVVSALLEERTPLHLSLDEAIEFGKKVGAKETFITHMSHKIDHELVSQKLAPGVKLGIDGMEIEFEY
jgi:phosphoribosyl 1,2-cyclic phosphate phosphodiesterase